MFIYYVVSIGVKVLRTKLLRNGSNIFESM